MAISSEKIRSYKIEIVLIIFVIIALIISIDIDAMLIKIGQEGREPTSEEARTIKRKAEFVSLVYLIASIYFAYAAYRDYKENKTTSNFYFFIATILLVFAAGIREYWLNKTPNFEGGAEDFAL